MSGNQTNTAQISILCTEDSTSNVLVNRSFSPSLDAQAGVFGTYFASPTGVTVLQNPQNVSVLWNVYVRNLNPVGGTDLGVMIAYYGVSQSLLTLHPGDVFLYWGNSNSLGSVTGAGIASVQIQMGTAPFEYFIGG